jgi:hypothetical protein
MSRVPLSNRKFQKKTSDRLHQPQHVQGRTNTMQRKVFTKPSRTPAADRYKIVNVKCQVPSPTTVARRDVKRDLEQKNKRAKEQTPSTRDRHSAKRMREIYVNPNKDKPSHKPKSASKEIQRTKVQNEEATVKEKVCLNINFLGVYCFFRVKLKSVTKTKRFKRVRLCQKHIK